MNGVARRAPHAVGALVLGVGALILAGCEPQRSARGRWTPYGATPAAPPTASAPYYATGPDPYRMPGGSEARDPWGSRAQPATPPSAFPPDAGSFLLITTLQGPNAVDREPVVNALLARLGGVRRAPTLWEITPQPGGGLGSVAAALESDLCAEDIVVVYRARGHAMERSEFAGHKVCPAPSPATPPAAGAPAKKPGGINPLRTRF